MKMTTKEIKQAYRDAVSMEPAWSGNQRMIDYICKRADEVVVLENGDMVAIEKPDIKKNFCFGYGSWGPTYKEALEDAQNARENYDYFMDKNLEQIDRIIREYMDTRRTEATVIQNLSAASTQDIQRKPGSRL